MYGCPPEKYDHEIEADARQSEELKKLCSNFWISNSDLKRYCNSQFSGKKNYKTQSNIYGQYFSSHTGTNNHSNNPYSGDGVGNLIGDLLTIGIVIGGAYLLRTALTPATPQPATRNIFITIIQDTKSAHLGVYGTPLGH